MATSCNECVMESHLAAGDNVRCPGSVNGPKGQKSNSSIVKAVSAIFGGERTMWTMCCGGCEETINAIA